MADEVKQAQAGLPTWARLLLVAGVTCALGGMALTLAGHWSAQGRVYWPGAVNSVGVTLLALGMLALPKHRGLACVLVAASVALAPVGLLMALGWLNFLW